jgi:hypothetical protein
MTVTDEDLGLGCSLSYSRNLPSLHSQSFNFVKYKKCHVDKQYTNICSLQPDTCGTELTQSNISKGRGKAVPLHALTVLEGG